MRIRVLAASVLAVATLAACGSSGGSPSANGKQAVTNSQSSAKSPAAGGGSSSKAGATDPFGGSGDYCNTLKAQAAALAHLESSAGQSSFVKNVAAVADAMQKIDASAPADIKPSWDVFAAGFKAFMDAMTKAGVTQAQYDDPSKLTPAQLQAIGQATGQFASPQFTQAATAISTDAQKRCGIDLNGSSSGGETPAPSNT